VGALSGVDLLAAAKLSPGELAGLVGGSPCQGFSNIGHRDTLDKRNDLFADFFRLVSETRPRFFVAENVPGILDDRNSDLVNRALDFVRSEYQLMKPLILNASDFGAPTFRRRVFFVGYLPTELESIMAHDFEQEKCKSPTTVQNALVGLPKKLRASWLTDDLGWRKIRGKSTGVYWTKISTDIPEGVGDQDTISKLLKEGKVSGCIATDHSRKVVARFAALAEGATDDTSRSTRLSRAGLCPTLRAGTGKDKGSYQAVRPIHFSESRVITPREAARLQGFPDWFRLHQTKWHSFRGIGNSVSPLLAEAIFRVLITKLANDQTRSSDLPAVELSEPSFSV
jgi:DNA (cytosine-5)-methyltransferase 1